MCRNTPTTTTTTTTASKSNQIEFLWSLKSFHSGNDAYPLPSLSSMLFTTCIVIATLTSTEMMGRWIIYQLRHMVPNGVLDDVATHRHILARHIFVDSLSCAVVSYMGWADSHLLQGIWTDSVHCVTSFFRKSNDPSVAGFKSAIPKAAYAKRLYEYHPAGVRISLYFIAYQLKNLYDTLVWNDGPEFVMHHIFSIITAYGAIFPGTGYMYPLFYFGLSEISTAVLCLLANFDEDKGQGVAGLGDALPVTKIVLGGLFVVTFIACRCIMWPVISYYFCRDILQGFEDIKPERKKNNPKEAELASARIAWFRFFFISLSTLSVLQVLWLGEIFRLGHRELVNMGYV